jgi:hypothetical protein
VKGLEVLVDRTIYVVFVRIMLESNVWMEVVVSFVMDSFRL